MAYDSGVALNYLAAAISNGNMTAQRDVFSVWPWQPSWRIRRRDVSVTYLKRHHLQ